LRVAALSSGEVGGEILRVDLPTSPEESDLVQGHAPNLDDQNGVVVLRGQRGLHGFAKRLAQFLRRDHQPTRGLARLHAAGALPARGIHVHAEFAAEAELAVRPAIPTGQAVGIGESGPQVIDISGVAFLDAYYTRAVGRSQAPHN